jgi:DNA-binding transcriptional LysR family regulator
MYNLTLRQLQTFQEVMRCGSLATAAKTLHRTQPALSILIANLEKELGFPLFERKNRRLIPKPEALYLLEEVNEILGRLQRSVRTLQEIADLKRGQLKIAFMPASTLLMSHLVGSFTEDKPDVKVSLMMRSSTVIADWIGTQQYDIGLAETPEDRDSINVETFSFQCICAMPANDELASLDVITPGDLDGKPLALLYNSHTTTQQVTEQLSNAGAQLHLRYELQTFLPGLELVAQKLCYCICDPISAKGYQDLDNQEQKVVFKPLSFEIKLNVSLLTPAHRPMSNLCIAFYDHASKRLRAMLNGLIIL